jgi:predicted RND superfamily exporter protein
MADSPVDYQRYVEVVDDWIVNRSKHVVVAFLVATLVLSGGFGMTATDSGTSQFTEGVPAQEAFDNVQDDFESEAFTDGTGTTQLIQRGGNVLSKPAMLRMLRAQHRLNEADSQHVVSTTSVASVVARTLDPRATTLDAQVDAMESASPAEVQKATHRALTDNPGLQRSLSEDLNVRSTEATATIAVVTHSVSGVSDSAGTQGDSPMTPIQEEAAFIVGSVGGDITVFGSGLISAELGSVISDSLTLVIPAAVVLILLFLIVAYRDPFDLGIGLLCLAMAITWTFGFMGWAGIAFSQMLIAVPPLLLAVGIDFGIHAVNRYREERVEGVDISTSMRTATDQLLPAFLIVTGTTVLGFAANGVSDLGPIRDFGFVAATGIVFTFLIFGIFLPALKHYLDHLREGTGIPQFSVTPMGSEESALGAVLPVGVKIARLAPRAFLVVVLLSTAVMGAYGAGVDTRFTTEDFLPPEENPEYLEYLPASVQPSDYTVTDNINYLEENFESSEGDSVTIYLEGPLTRDYALESMHKATQDPPDSFVTAGRTAESTSIVTVIRTFARQNPEFAAVVDRNDLNDNGIPDQNLGVVYAHLFASDYGSRAASYLTPDYTSARVEFSVKGDASQAAVTADTRAVADRYRQAATATGSVVVLKAVSDIIAESAFVSLALALAASAAFLTAIYWVLEGRASLGIANLVPIVVTVAAIATTMRYLDIPFNVLTGTTLSIGIGLGIDYSAHLVHRFADEYDEHDDVFDALTRTVNGTGGALAGSMVTTVSGTGVLVLAITPILGQFGLLIAVSVLYSFVASVLVLPATLVVWHRSCGGAADRGDSSWRRVLAG